MPAPREDTVDPQDLLHHPLIGSRYFFPRRDAVPDPFWIRCGEVSLACLYARHQADAPTIIHFHGNGETAADWGADLAAPLVQRGYNCLLVEYRGYGASGGTPALGALLADVGPILEAIDTPLSRCVFFGRSVGSLFALEAAARAPQAAGLVLESAIADPEERLRLRVSPAELGVSDAAFSAQIQARLDPRPKLQAFGGAVLVLHTEADALVSVRHAQQLYDWAQEPKSIHRFPRGGHNDILWQNFSAYWDALDTFLTALFPR